MTSASVPDEAAAALAQDGLNRLQGLVGPLPEAAAALRFAYLNWADQVERLLRDRGAMDGPAEAVLHSPRHRDLVAGVIPHDVLAREVFAERDVRLRLLDGLKEASATGTGARPAPIELSGGQGETYRYFLDRPLGGGGFGRVYEATTVDGLALAVKRVPLRTVSTARWFADARLAERELDVALRLGLTTEENVLPVLDHVLDDDALLLVMPRAEHSLADVIAGGRHLDEADTRTLLLDLAAGMRLLADRGVVHRDIKPGNVLWWRNRWVLSDLGVARIIEADTSTYTWAGTGSPNYWAPELFAFEPATVRSDLYALGCTAFEALTGTPPFTGDDLARAHRTAVPELPALADAALDRTLRRLLSKEPDARPVDAREVEQLLVPADGLGPDQTALLRFAARAVKENEQQVQRGRAAQQEEARRRDAHSAFARIWEDAVARARQVLPDAEGFEQDGTWFLRVVGTRLSVTLAEPSSSTAALLIGLLRVQFLDRPGGLNPANVRGRQQDGRAVWELLTFQHNMISTERPPLGPGRGSGAPAGMSVSHLDALLDRLDLPGPPIVITHSVPLSPESLLQVVVDALED